MIRLWLVLLTVCWGARPVQSECGPVEEGRSITLTCDISTASCPVSGMLLGWYLPVSGAFALSCNRFGQCDGILSRAGLHGTIGPTRSILTIPRVSRTMETKWDCISCTDERVTACEKLLIYALPENPECTLSVVPVSGDTQSVRLSCSTSRVYPRAECRFYIAKNRGNLEEIDETPSYNHPNLGSYPFYYRSECSVSVPVEDLGEGTHSFTGYIYPGGTKGRDLVSGIDNTITLALSQASHTCSTNIVQGYFQGKSARCTCSLTSDGNPRGTARWYKGDDGQTVGSDGALTVMYDENNPDQTFTCEAFSALGHGVGSTLTANFAFIEPNSVQVESSQSTVNLFDISSNNSLPVVTCRISRENVIPAPTFSFSLEGLVFEEPQPGSVNGIYYERQFQLSPVNGGVYQVTCRVINTIFDTHQESRVTVIFTSPQQVVPSFRAQPVVQDNTAQIEIEIYGFPTPSVLTLAKRNEGTDLTGSPRHAVRYTPGVAPFGRVIVTILELVEADFTSYTLTVDNGVGEAMVYDFTLEDGNDFTLEDGNDFTLEDGESESDRDYLIVAAIIVAVVALGIVVVLIVIRVYLLRRSRSELTQRPGSPQAPPSGPALHYKSDGEYLAPLETPMPDVSPAGTSRSSGTYNNMPGRTADDSVNMSSGGSGKPGLAGDYANA